MWAGRLLGLGRPRDVLHCRVRLVLGKVVDVEAVVGVAARASLAGFCLLAADFHHELDGSVEAAVEVAVVAGEVVEEFRPVEQHGFAQQLQIALPAFSDAVAPNLFLIDAGAFDVGGDVGGFDAGEAPHSPRRVGDLANDFFFDAVSGEVGVLVGGEVPVELGGVFAWDDGILGQQAVFEGVFRDAGLALGSARPGGFFRVFAVCLDLGIGCHD